MASNPSVRVHLEVSDGALTLLKLIGLAAMLADHYNSFVRPEFSILLYELGRLALPLFAFVLGYNLARMPAAKMPAMMLRLLVFGVIATPLYTLLGSGFQYWWPMNILFTLLVAVTTVYLLVMPATDRRRVLLRVAALAVFVIGGSLVDYFWVGPALVVVIWRWFASLQAGWTADGQSIVLLLMLAALGGLLCMLNGNLAALLAPLLTWPVLAWPGPLVLPRMKWLFYWFYPGHLAALLLLKVMWG